MCCSAIATMMVQCNVVETRKTGCLHSMLSLLNWPLRGGGGTEYRFLFKIHMNISTCTFLIWSFVSANLIQGVRFDQQVGVKDDAVQWLLRYLWITQFQTGCMKKVLCRWLLNPTTCGFIFSILNNTAYWPPSCILSTCFMCFILVLNRFQN